ncbi:Uncharacterised protein [Mycobacteroides abscessus subsp. abscessus]|nr:Uncharacterised protein [Mycobacteroides abscessus subsp. abscessus]
MTSSSSRPKQSAIRYTPSAKTRVPFSSSAGIDGSPTGSPYPTISQESTE